jgi:hypothetical protein
MKIERGENSTSVLEAADQLMPFGGPVQLKIFDASPALLAQNITAVSLLLRMSRTVQEVASVCLCLLIPCHFP